MTYDANDKKTILYRLFYLVMAAGYGSLPILIAQQDSLSKPWTITLNTIIAFLVMATSAFFGLYFLYHSLFLKQIRKEKQEADRMQNRQKMERLATLCVEQQRKIDDTPAVILLENLSDFEELENHIFDILYDVDEQNGKNFPLLRKQGDNHYVITFPFGVSRLFLYELADGISVFCTCTLHLWAKSELFKKHCGEWIYLCIGAEDLLVAVTEDGTQWEISPDDAMLHHSKKHERSYRAFPDLEWGGLERQRFL